VAWWFFIGLLYLGGVMYLFFPAQLNKFFEWSRYWRNRQGPVLLFRVIGALLLASAIATTYTTLSSH
jgi:hypothetical protein